MCSYLSETRNVGSPSSPLSNVEARLVSVVCPEEVKHRLVVDLHHAHVEPVTSTKHTQKKQTKTFNKTNQNQPKRNLKTKTRVKFWHAYASLKVQKRAAVVEKYVWVYVVRT